MRGPRYFTFKGERAVVLPRGWADGVSNRELSETTEWTQLLTPEGELQLSRIPEAREASRPPFRSFREASDDGDDTDVS